MKARMAIAYAMTLDGSVYGPLFERLEAEIAGRRVRRGRHGARQRAFDYASVAAPVVGVKAIS